MRDQIKLQKRQGEILAAVVRLFVAGGIPVGSRVIAEHLQGSLSSATVRNVLAELEAAGFLHQPHVSAGRVPTDRAYRYYVDWLVEATRLEPETQKYIDESLSSETASPEQLMARSSRVLSEVSHNVGVVLGPRLAEKLLEHIELVKLPDRRILAVIVSRPDLIENTVIRVNEDFSQEELDRAADFLNAEFRRWSLRTIRVEIFKRLEEMKALCDRLVSTVATLFIWGALGGEEPGPLFVDGTASVLSLPEFEDTHRLTELLRALEEKARLARILSACLESSASGVRALIGRENSETGMQHCAIVLAPYRYRNRVVGAVGVVGPTRMEYDRAITTVDYVARLCSRLLSSN